MIRDRGVALRYAGALFGAAEKRNELEAVLADLEALINLNEVDPSFKNFLESPSVLDEHKEEMVRTILEGRVQPLVLRFLNLMLEKKRIQHFPLVYKPYRSLVEERLGIVRARVMTAVPLVDELLQEIRAQLQTLTGKKVDIETGIDPKILGGTVVTVGGRILDSSLRYKLEELRDELLAAQVH